VKYTYNVCDATKPGGFMLIVHLFAGFVAAFSLALWAWLDGASFWAMLGLYVLGGNLGVAASATVSLILPRTTAPTDVANLHPAE
jgi:hypothetical protein